MSNEIAVNDTVICDGLPRAKGKVVDIFTLPEVGRRALVDWVEYRNQSVTDKFSRFHSLDSLKKIGRR